MIELLSLIGSAGAGKAFGIITDLMEAKANAKRDADERAFKTELAIRGQLDKYMQNVHGFDDHGKPSLMSYTLCGLYWMFGITVCLCATYCFLSGFGHETVHIKDPDTKGGSFSIFGIFTWAFNPDRITSLSPVGVGYLILHPILFILSMVSTGGNRPRRRS